jgi:hypothetical protein
MVKNIHDRAAGLEMRYHHARNAEGEHMCREIRLRAASKGGELLIAMEEAGLRTDGRPRRGFKVGAPLGRSTLAELGVTKEESRRWQRLARMSKAEFAALLAGKPARRHMPYRGIEQDDFAARRDSHRSRETCPLVRRLAASTW